MSACLPFVSLHGGVGWVRGILVSVCLFFCPPFSGGLRPDLQNLYLYFSLFHFLLCGRIREEIKERRGKRRKEKRDERRREERSEKK